MSEFELTFARSGGPGGQNVNKVNSKAMLRWPVTTSPSLPEPVRARFLEKYGNRVTVDGDLILTCQKYRDQASNIEGCTEKLREMLLTVVAPPVPRRPTKPTFASKQKRVDTKKQQGQKKQSRRAPRGDD